MIVGCTVENQDRADFRLSIFQSLPIKHRNVICQPLIEDINIEKYLDNVQLVVVGGESDRNARPLNYNWVLSIREQCITKGVPLNLGNAELTLSKMVRNTHLMSKIYVVRQEKQILTVNNSFRERLHGMRIM